MDKGKMIPIIISIVLSILALVLLVNMFLGKKTTYSKLLSSYNNQNEEYKDIKIDHVYVINNVSFWIKSIEKEKIILQSSIDLKDENGKETSEFIINKNIDTKACFSNDSCVLFKLV